MGPSLSCRLARQVTILGVALSFATSPAWANGRSPSSVAVVTREGRPDLLIATTFGVLLSKDDGCSFRWLCEQNIGYGGTFDPKYAIGADGTIYATTFEGLRVSRDGGCSFATATAGTPPSDPGALDGIWVDAIDLAPNGDVWLATAESGRFNDVYRSRDGARTFEPMGLHSAAIWWKSVKISRQHPARIYVTGYQIAGTTPEGGQMPPTAHLRRSDDGGATWTPMPLTGVALAATPLVHVLAIDPTNADVLYLRSTAAAPPGGDKLYRSYDGGTTFTEVLRTTEPIRGMAIRTGSIIVAAGMEGAYESSNGGVAFAPIANAPRMACIDERGAGELFACGTNWDPDFLSVGRSSDGHAWQKLFRFGDMNGPLECPPGTVQHDTCELTLWPSLREQFGAAAETSCPITAPDAAAPPTRAKRGCCDGGGGASGGLLLLMLTALATLGRRRPARSGRS